MKKRIILLSVTIFLMVTTASQGEEIAGLAHPHFAVARQWENFLQDIEKDIKDWESSVSKQKISLNTQKLKTKRNDLNAFLVKIEKEFTYWESLLTDDPNSISRIKDSKKEISKEAKAFQEKLDSLIKGSTDFSNPKKIIVDNLLPSSSPENKTLIYNFDFHLFQESPATPPPPDYEVDLAQRLLPDVKESPPEEELLTLPSFNSIEEVYSYLYDNFIYQPYYGVLKGPEETLRSQAGNDFDLSQLLMALLRNQGYSARYVYGEVKFPLSQIQNWLGTSDPDLICRILHWATKAPVKIVEDNDGRKIWFWHLWLEVNLDTEGENWVSLDPSFKQYSFSCPSLSFLPFLPEDYWNNNPELLPIGDYFLRWKKYLAQNSSLTEFIPWKREILPNGSSFPTSLPYEEYEVLVKTEKISYRNYHRMRLILPGIDVCLNTSELAGEKISLFYRAAPESKKAADRLGGILTCPPFLLSLQPVLELNNRRIIGETVSAGEVQLLEIHFLTPGEDAEVYTYPVKAGTYLTAFVNLGTVPPQKIGVTARHFGALTSAPIIQSLIKKKEENYVGELLYLTLLSYFYQLNSQINFLSTYFPVNLIPLPSLAILETDLEMDSVLSLPWRLKLEGLNFQIIRNSYALYPFTHDVPLDIFNSLCAFQGVAVGEEVFMQMFYANAISVPKLFCLSPPDLLSPDNIQGENIDALPFPEIVKEIGNNLDKMIIWGNKQEIHFQNFIGQGYFWRNLDASRFRFRLSYRHGSMAEVSEGLSGLLAMVILDSLPFSEKEGTAYRQFWSYWSSDEDISLLKSGEFVKRYLQESKKFIGWNFELGYDPRRKVIDCAQLLEQAFIHATGIHLPLTVADGLANNYVLGGFLIPDIPVWIQIPFPYTKSAFSLQAGDITFYDLAPEDVDPPGDGNIEHSGIYCGNGYWLWASATIDLSGDGKPEVVYFHQEHPGKYGRQMKDMTEKIFMQRRWTYPEN